MSGYWKRVENDLLHADCKELVTSQAFVRSSDKAGYELRMAICTYQIAHKHNDFKIGMSGWTRKELTDA